MVDFRTALKGDRFSPEVRARALVQVYTFLLALPTSQVQESELLESGTTDTLEMQVELG